MKKYKLLRYGHCYVNKAGDFAVALLSGNHIHGYVCAASVFYPNLMYGTIRVGSRIVPNDGHWVEIDAKTFNLIRWFHVKGIKGKPTPKGGHVEFSMS